MEDTARANWAWGLDVSRESLLCRLVFPSLNLVRRSIVSGGLRGRRGEARAGAAVSVKSRPGSYVASRMWRLMLSFILIYGYRKRHRMTELQKRSPFIPLLHPHDLRDRDMSSTHTPLETPLPPLDLAPAPSIPCHASRLLQSRCHCSLASRNSSPKASSGQRLRASSIVTVKCLIRPSGDLIRHVQRLLVTSCCP